MDIREGERRLSKALIWLVAICIWVLGPIALIMLCYKFEVIADLFLLFLFFIIIMGFIVHEISRRAVMWIIKGFAGDEIIKKENDE